MKFIDLLNLDFNTAKTAFINCECKSFDAEDCGTFSSDMLLLDNGLLVGSTNTLDLNDTRSQLIVGYHTPEVLYFHALTPQNFGYKYLAVKGEDDNFNGRFRSESLFSGETAGTCEINLRDNPMGLCAKEKLVEQINQNLKDFRRDIFADMIFEQIEEFYDIREIQMLLNKAGNEYKNNPTNICLDEPTIYK